VRLHRNASGVPGLGGLFLAAGSIESAVHVDLAVLRIHVFEADSFQLADPHVQVDRQRIHAAVMAGDVGAGHQPQEFGGVDVRL
jgi:hypothetical protein